MSWVICDFSAFAFESVIGRRVLSGSRVCGDSNRVVSWATVIDGLKSHAWTFGFLWKHHMIRRRLLDYIFQDSGCWSDSWEMWLLLVSDVFATVFFGMWTRWGSESHRRNGISRRPGRFIILRRSMSSFSQCAPFFRNRPTMGWDLDVLVCASVRWDWKRCRISWERPHYAFP